MIKTKKKGKILHYKGKEGTTQEGCIYTREQRVVKNLK